MGPFTRWTHDVPGGLVEGHHVVLLLVHLVNGLIDLAIMLTTSVMCHVCF